MTAGLAVMERSTDRTVAKTGEPHTACGAAHTEMTAYIEEASLSVRAAIGSEYYLVCLAEQRFEVALQFFVGD